MRHITMILVGLVALTSVEMAVAHGMPVPVGQMVLCTGHGVRIVLVDADGVPTRAAHLCPDTALNLFVDAGLPVPLVGPHAVMQAVRLSVVLPLAAPRSGPRAQARDPPVLI